MPATVTARFMVQDQRPGRRVGWSDSVRQPSRSRRGRKYLNGGGFEVMGYGNAAGFTRTFGVDTVKPEAEGRYIAARR